MLDSVILTAPFYLFYFCTLMILSKWCLSISTHLPSYEIEATSDQDLSLTHTETLVCRYTHRDIYRCTIATE